MICPICGSKNITEGMFGKVHCVDCKKHPEVIPLATPQVMR